QLVETLKENRDMDWRFTTRPQAMERIEKRDYFAVLIIPDDFSEKLGSVIPEHPAKAELDYNVNEKINSIEPKITEKGASVIVDKVSRQFISTVNGVIFDLFNQLGIELQHDLPDIEKFENYIFDMEKQLPHIHDVLKSTTRDAASAQDLIHKAQGKVPTAKQSIEDGLTTVNHTLTFLDNAENRLNEIA